MLNKVILMGRLTADPELRRTASERAVTSFSLAVDRSYAKRGEPRQTDFIDCVAWGTTAEFICKWLGKGRQVAITGRLQVRPWEDKTGQKRRSTEVIVDEAFFADSKQDGGGQSAGGRGSYGDRGSQIPPAPQQGGQAAPFELGPEGNDYAELDIDDIELPY